MDIGGGSIRRGFEVCVVVGWGWGFDARGLETRPYFTRNAVRYMTRMPRVKPPMLGHENNGEPSRLA